MAIRLNLDDATCDGETSILFSINSQDIKRFRIASLKRIHPNDWNAEGQQAKKSYGKKFGELNRVLTDRKREIENAIITLQSQQKPININTVQNLLTWGRKKVPAKQALFTDLIDQFTEHKKSSGKVKAITLSGYGSTFNVVKEYMRVKEVQLDIHTFSEDDFNLFRAYCQDERGNKNNGFDKTAKNLGVFLRWCKERGITEHDGAKAIERTATEKDISPLSVEELAVLEKAVPEYSGMHGDVLKMFLMQCYTGLRIKDLKELKVASVKKNVISINTSKTQTKIKIPIIKQARDILNHYLPGAKGTVFPEMVDQVYNRYLKQICKELDLNREVIETSYYGPEMVKKTRLLCDAITSHDGRRTFITLSLSGMGTWQLMQITGHENFDSFKKYVFFSETESTKQLIAVWDKIHTNPDVQRYEELTNAMAIVQAFAEESLTADVYRRWNKINLGLIDQYKPEV